MKFVKIDPPGTWCLRKALFDMLGNIEGRRFLEVGCGEGETSLKLLERGYTGVGVDFSAKAVERASKNLECYIEKGKYRLVESDFSDKTMPERDFDIAISLLVMEHIHDDVGFLERLKSHVRPGGHVIVCVPSRKDKWSLEDDTVGHLRRYDREDLFRIFKKVGFVNIEAWSVAVPVANALLGLSNMAIKYSGEGEKARLSMEEQTKSSGVRDIPFKTVFPSFFKVLINSVTLWPLFMTQRLFYRTGLGLTMLVKAQRP